MVQVSREYASDPRQLADLRSLVSETGRNAWGSDTDEDALDQLVLAVHEAAANIIRHAYGGEIVHPIYVHIEGDPEHVGVKLSYHGRRDFDPDAVVAPSFDGSREGGFGLYLIRELVDEVRYSRDSAGLSVIWLLKKRT